MREIDYDLLLDEWTEKVLKKADEADRRKEDYEPGSYGYAYNRGYAEGLRMATAILGRLEKQYKDTKKHIQELVEG